MIFEYKVRARHRLGWKEFKLYADTDIEEFFNRNSIDYVRNLTDTVENKQQQEIERLHSIIKEVREYITSYESIETIQQCEHSENNKGLDRDTIIEMINRHLKVHDKILEILDKEK